MGWAGELHFPTFNVLIAYRTCSHRRTSFACRNITQAAVLSVLLGMSSGDAALLEGLLFDDGRHTYAKPTQEARAFPFTEVPDRLQLCFPKLSGGALGSMGYSLAVTRQKPAAPPSHLIHLSLLMGLKMCASVNVERQAPCPPLLTVLTPSASIIYTVGFSTVTQGPNYLIRSSPRPAPGTTSPVNLVNQGAGFHMNSSFETRC